MTTITRERLEQIYAECEERDPAIFEIRELVRIALAACDARPEGYIHVKALNDMRDRSSLLGRVWVDDTGSGDCVPLYATPPAPVVPEEMPKGLAGQIVSLLAHNIGDKFLAQKIWNACRAALLQGAEPVSQTYELPQTQFEQVADLYEMQFDDGRTCAFHTDGTKAAQWLLACDGNKVQEYVRIERYQEAVIGNTPVQSPIDHGYRPECECSGCKATARICAELNNEEAEIFADGYNAAMLKVNKNASTELPNDANLSTNSPVIPDGYALVPVEPTDEMIAAAMNCEDVLFNSDESFCVQFGNIYEAMLAAAPQQEQR